MLEQQIKKSPDLIYGIQVTELFQEKSVDILNPDYSSVHDPKL
jgi:hypothetical protein